MSETDTTTEATTDASEAVTETPPTPDTTSDPDFKSKWEAQKKVNRDLERKLNDALRRIEESAAKTAEEREALERQRKAEEVALAKANERILKAEVRAAAADKLSDPADALRFIDLGGFDVGDDGSVDTDAISDAVADLLSKKPYLAKNRDGAPKVQGSADGGTREASRPRQLTRDDLKGMSPQAIDEARREGRMRDLLAGKA